MPRNVRNFWIETEVDGLSGKMKSGPRSKTGGFVTTVLVRDQGNISENYLVIEGEADDEGDLLLTVKMHRKGSVTKMQLVTARDSEPAPAPIPQRPDAFWKEVNGGEPST